MVDQLQEEGMPLLAAFSTVAERLDLDVSAIDRCYEMALSDEITEDERETLVYRRESFSLAHSHNVPDPFDIEADWEENLSL
jgi:hypothetical protein